MIKNTDQPVHINADGRKKENNKDVKISNVNIHVFVGNVGSWKYRLEIRPSTTLFDHDKISPSISQVRWPLC